MQNSAAGLLFLVIAGALCHPAAAAEAGRPLSAIDWLSRSVETPAAEPGEDAPGTETATDPPDATQERLPPKISARPLGPPEPETGGLVAAGDLGLPGDLWGASTAEDIALRLARLPDNLPATARDLLRRVLIVRQDSPAQGDDLDILLKARVDALLEMGALDAARLLLGARPPEDAELFRRWFDIALLTGGETEACRWLAERPDLSPTYPARIFCLARNGDWHVAALTLGTAESLGILSPEEDALLARFLDPELFDAVPPPPRRPTPLLFRLYEAAGDRLPTLALPLAFAHADLAPILGWKARLEASERLARAGVLGPGDLFDVYSERGAAASGGRRSLLRMAAYQGRPSVPPAYVDPDAPEDAFLAALVAGDPSGAPAPSPLSRAIRDGFLRQRADGPLADLEAADRKGEALFLALGWIGEANAGDPDRLAEALALLRRLGLDDTARRIAVDLLIEAERA